MGNIDWLPIKDIPETMKDGRRTLLWAGDIRDAEIACWEDGLWWTPAGVAVKGVTHFAEVSPPA